MMEVVCTLYEGKSPFSVGSTTVALDFAELTDDRSNSADVLASATRALNSAKSMSPGVALEAVGVRVSSEIAWPESAAACTVAKLSEAVWGPEAFRRKFVETYDEQSAVELDVLVASRARPKAAPPPWRLEARRASPRSPGPAEPFVTVASRRRARPRSPPGRRPPEPGRGRPGGGRCRRRRRKRSPRREGENAHRTARRPRGRRRSSSSRRRRGRPRGSAARRRQSEAKLPRVATMTTPRARRSPAACRPSRPGPAAGRSPSVASRHRSGRRRGAGVGCGPAVVAGRVRDARRREESSRRQTPAASSRP